MKINLIYHDFSSNVVLDAEVFNFIFKKFREKPKVVSVNVNNYKCDEADINIFLEKINYSYFSKAKYNIFVPNQQYFDKTMEPFLESFDLVLAKTSYTYELFSKYVNKDKLKNIGFRSPDISLSTHKDYNEYLAFYQDSKFYDVQKVIDAWDNSMPNLNVVIQSQRSDVNLKQQNNIKYIKDTELDNTKFQQLFNNCGVHLCLTEAESFSHLINQCKLCKSIPVSFNGGSMKELLNRDYSFYVDGKKKKLKQGYGSKYIFNKDSLIEVVKTIQGMSENTLAIMGNNARTDSLKTHGIFDIKFKEVMNDIFKIVKPLRFDRKDIEEDKLPYVSIITLTHNRKNMFPLSIYNYQTIDYPKNKLEWIIIDDSNSEHNVSKLLPNVEDRNKMNIKYFSFNEKKNIGFKRNFAVENSIYDVIIVMDDDDYYPPESIKKRVTHLIKTKKQCVFSTVIGCFEINKLISIISSPPMHIFYEEKLSEATLCFYKKFWEDGKFSETDSNEGAGLIKDRISDVAEMSFQDVIVSLIHKNNSSTRTIPHKQAPNGCHFGWNDKLFKFITSLDK